MVRARTAARTDQGRFEKKAGLGALAKNPTADPPLSGPSSISTVQDALPSTPSCAEKLNQRKENSHQNSHSDIPTSITGTGKQDGTSSDQQGKSSRETTTFHHEEQGRTKSGVPNAELLLGQLDQIRTFAAGPPSRSLQATGRRCVNQKKQVDSTVDVNVRGCHFERRTQILAAGSLFQRKKRRRKTPSQARLYTRTAYRGGIIVKRRRRKIETSDQPAQDDRYIYVLKTQKVSRPNSARNSERSYHMDGLLSFVHE